MKPTDYNKLDQAGRRAVRIQYIKDQHNRCYHCGASLSGEPSFEIAAKKVTPKLYPAGFFKNKIHLHHNHRTGMTIGAVHAHCNAVLWEYHDE